MSECQLNTIEEDFCDKTILLLSRKKLDKYDEAALLGSPIVPTIS